MIIDEALSTKASPFTHPMMIQRARSAAMQAKRFVFDTDASRLLGKFVDGCMDLIIENRQFAMPLYDVMYFEFDTRAMYGEIDGRPAGPMDRNAPDRDEIVGFLFDHRTVYTVAKGPLSCNLMPVFNYINERGQYEIPDYGRHFPAYELTPYLKVGTLDDTDDNARMAKLTLMYGSKVFTKDPFKRLGIEPDQTILSQSMRGLADEVWYYYAGVIPADILPVDGHQRLLTEIVGDVRNMTAALLWLNSLPHTVKYVPVPAGHKLYKGKRLALSAHNIVTIHMRGSVQVRNLFTKALHDRQHPRRHDVRGFWRHSKGIAQGCGHNWPVVPDQRHKYVCSKCGRERWWVRAHERGDISKGRVTKEYHTEI